MSQMSDTISQLKGEEFLGNSYFEYTVSAITFLVIILGLFLVKRISIKNFSRFSRESKSKFGSIVKNTISKYFSMKLILLLSFLFSTSNLVFPTFIETSRNTITYAIISWIIIKLVLNIIDAVIDLQRDSNSKNIHILEFFRMLTRTFIIIMVIIWFLSNIGFDVTAFIAGLGVMSLAIAFALKEIIADIFASLVIFIDSPFEVGDGIKLDNDAGSIEKIGIRSTHIRSVEGHLIVVSNRELTSKKVHNMKNMPRRRVNFTLRLSQNTPISFLEEFPLIISKYFEKIQSAEFDKINLISIGDYSFDYELIYYVLTRDIKVHGQIKQNILFEIIRIFENYKLEILFPTQTIIIDK
ncbi:MAG: mechanosensitive ion channel [Candidatus Heimdallarchaeota archaeon]|nr:mechanosensitive ion channel [Candidatus Heimdallarchaeota archaeon]